jgi:hypothetical protein
MRAWLIAASPVVLALVGTVGVLPGVAIAERVSGCDHPLAYDVVRVDPGHHISRDAFVALLERSERLWEIPTGKDLFRYQRGGKVHVSLIYDNRQALENKIEAEDRSIARMRASLARQRADIRAQKAKLEVREAVLSTRIGYWNSRGGAPDDLRVELKAEAAAIDRLVTAFNAQVQREHVSIARFNAFVRARNALVGKRGNGELGRAQLGGTEVLIVVLTGTAKDDVLVAHEFGHILGLKHNPGADNIMNPASVKALGRASPSDLQVLQKACASR